VAIPHPSVDYVARFIGLVYDSSKIIVRFQKCVAQPIWSSLSSESASSLTAAFGMDADFISSVRKPMAIGGGKKLKAIAYEIVGKLRYLPCIGGK